MRSPDRGSTKRPAVLHGRRPPAGRAQRVNPPLTAIFKEEPELTFRLFFTYSPPRGMRSPDRGSTKRPAVLHGRRPPAGRAQRVNPPLTATFKEESRLTSGLFFCIFCAEGDEKPRPGFDKTARRFAWPQATRRASAASESPSHRHLQRRA
ncbi:hypothetical protein QE443_002377 [Pantoea ananatis]|nr:hypothetical protein [Pantoea ananatis]